MSRGAEQGHQGSGGKSGDMIPIHRYWAAWKFLCQREVRANLEILGKLKIAAQA
jgi:hypothetical protein